MAPDRRLVCSRLAALAVLAASPAIAFAPPRTAPPTGALADIVAAAAQRFGLPPTWIWAVMRAESAGDPHAVSPAGAIGLMQVMPQTWASLRVR